MTQSVTEYEEFLVRFEAQWEEAMREKLAPFDRRALAWLALPPAWTVPLAAAAEFPIDDLDRFLHKVAEAGLCERGWAEDPEGELLPTFWMPDSVRTEVLDELRRRPQDGGTTSGDELPFLERTAYEIGVRVSKARKGNKLWAPPVLERWASLARHTGSGLSEATRWLTAHIRELVGKGDTATALGWIETGKSFALTLGGEVSTAVVLGNRSLELVYRRILDGRQLTNYLVRPQQIQPLDELLDRGSAEDAWALHYIGMGGVGKTMLLRHITARLAAEKKFTTSRVDFDYLSPDYPVRKPAQLLIELAEELRSYARDSKVEFLFEDFEKLVVQFHKELSAEPPADDPLANIRRPEFKQILRYFISALMSLPKPIVFVLDTCEELTKLPPVGDILPNVAATFEILEEIHGQVPETRVIFAGRRLLARSGNGWRAADASLAEGKKGYLPAEKKFLRLYEIRGIGEEKLDGQEESEIDLFFDYFFRRMEGFRLAPELKAAILERSPEIGKGAEVVYDPPRPAPEGKLFSPFDLALYADWVAEDPKLDAKTILSGDTDPYVELRIVRRIKDTRVRDAICPAVMLRRFDKSMLRLIYLPRRDVDLDRPLDDDSWLEQPLTIDKETFDHIYRELGDQEWIDYQEDRDLKTTFLEVDPRFYPRLLSYFAHPGRLDVVAPMRLGMALSLLIRQRKLSELSISHIDAALRLLPPMQGAHLWNHLEVKIANNARWRWARGVTDFLLGADGAVADEDHPLWPALSATRIAAILHEDPGIDVTGAWLKVEAKAINHPDSETASWLAARAALGQISANLSAGRAPDSKQLMDWATVLLALAKRNDLGGGGFVSFRLRQIAASFIAALHGLVEYFENDPQLVGSLYQPLLDWTSHRAPGLKSGALSAFSWLLAGRLAMRAGDWLKANEMLWLALGEDLSGDDLTDRWLDWPLPDSVVDRVRLEALRAPTMMAEIESSMLAGWQQEAEARLDSIDAERLVSRILQSRLRQAPIADEELTRLAGLESYDPEAPLKPVCQAHRRTPQLLTTLLEGWMALGRFDVIAERLEERTSRATSSTKDEWTVRELAETRVRFARRMRNADLAREATFERAASDDPRERDLAWTRIALTWQPGRFNFPAVDKNTDPETLHSWWRCMQALRDDDAGQLIDESPVLEAAGVNLRDEEADESFAVMAQSVDWLEATHVLEKLKQDGSGGVQVSGLATTPIEERWARHPEETERALRLLLRVHVLADSDISPEWEERYGARWLAELAFDEGALLALRLPGRAAKLLEQAHQWFEAAGDDVGVFQAATLHSIAAIRAFSRDEAKSVIREKLFASYDALRAGSPALEFPPRDELLEGIKSGQMLPEGQFGYNWNGWLERAMCCLAWKEDPDFQDVSLSLANWLEKKYVEGRDDAVAALPVELDLRLGMELEPEESRAATPEEGSEGISRRDWALIIFSIAFFLAVIGALLVGSYFLVGWLAGFAVHGGISTGSQIALTGLFMGVVVLLLWRRSALLARIRAPLIAGTQARLIITNATDLNLLRHLDLSAPVESRFALQLRQRKFFAIPPFRWREVPESAGGGKSPELRPYAESQTGIPEEISVALASLRDELRGRQLPVALELLGGLDPHPWEAVLTLAMPAPEKGEAVPEPFQFWRGGGRAIARGEQAQADILPLSELTTSWLVSEDWRRGGVFVGGSDKWGTMCAQSWSMVDGQPIVSQRVDRSGLEQKGGGVLHLIGRPRPMTAGLRLEIEDRRSEGAREVTKGAVKVSRSESRGVTLLDPEDLPLGSTQIVVLQKEPAELVEQRSPSERENMGYLRGFGAQIAQRQVPAVLVLPLLPSELTAEALRAFTESLGAGKTLSAKSLLVAVSALRQTIRDWAPPSPVLASNYDENGGSQDEYAGKSDDPGRFAAVLTELALDVTLYMRPASPER